MRRRLARGPVAVLPLLVVLLAQISAGGWPAPQTLPPPTPLPPNGSPSPFLTVVTTPEDPIPVPPIAAPSGLLVDLGTGQVLLQQGAHVSRPVASLTKVMTALVVLDGETRLDRMVRVHPDAVYGPREFGVSSTLGLRAGERISVEDLLAGLLVGSANDAAEALAIERAGSVSAFVEQMNVRARRLGLTGTRFASPHGLDDRGRSTAVDLLRLLEEARRSPVFRELVARRFARLGSGPGMARRIQNRNVLLWLYPGATGVKTGSTAGAGACLMATARRAGRELAVIVLGGRSEVFSDAASLLEHGFAAYQRRTLVEEGEPLGSLRVRGGEVPVVAAAGLSALVRTGPEARVERVLSTAPAAAYPPPPASKVGSLRVTLAGTTLGRVALLAGDLPPPREPPGPWWGRAAGAVARAVGEMIQGLFG